MKEEKVAVAGDNEHSNDDHKPGHDQDRDTDDEEGTKEDTPFTFVQGQLLNEVDG